METNLGDAQDVMKRLQNVHLTESQGAFMKKNVFQEEMRQLKRSYTEGRLSVDLMAAINEADDETKKSHTGTSEDTEPFDELALIEDDIVREERSIMNRLLRDSNHQPQQAVEAPSAITAVLPAALPQSEVRFKISFVFACQVANLK